MYKIKKIINNNALLAIEEDSLNEVVLLAKGIGYNHQVDQIIDDIEDAKKYIIECNKQIEISEVDPTYLKIAEEIIDNVTKTHENIDRMIIFALADHIAFAIERMRNNTQIINPFTKDISLLFNEEYNFALKSKDIIYKETGYLINDDEVGYIALHIHSALDKSSVAESMKNTIIINEVMDLIDKKYNIGIDKNSLSYARMLTHLKYLFVRLKNDEILNLDMDEYAKNSFVKSYEIAKDICYIIEEKSGLKIPNNEVGYLAIHIERIKTS